MTTPWHFRLFEVSRRAWSRQRRRWPTSSSPLVSTQGTCCCLILILCSFSALANRPPQIGRRVSLAPERRRSRRGRSSVITVYSAILPGGSGRSLARLSDRSARFQSCRVSNRVRRSCIASSRRCRLAQYGWLRSRKAAVGSFRSAMTNREEFREICIQYLTRKSQLHRSLVGSEEHTSEL